jgi:saccharopine dehydrogenase-like NADP-dependent oxidoreductase
MLDALCARLEERLRFAPGERDMVVLSHELLVERTDGGVRRLQRIRSSLLDYGTPHGDTAMAKTVGLPAAIAADLLLRGASTTPMPHSPSRGGTVG